MTQPAIPKSLKNLIDFTSWQHSKVVLLRRKIEQREPMTRKELRFIRAFVFIHTEFQKETSIRPTCLPERQRRRVRPQRPIQPGVPT